MGFFSEEAKAERRAKRDARRDPYDVTAKRLHEKRATLEPGTDEYERVSKEIKENIDLRASDRESKRRIAKADRGGIICKVLSILGAGVGIGSVIWAERQGMVFTGEKRSIMDAITRGIGNVFFRK